MRPTFANAGVAAQYRRQLTALITTLHESVEGWLRQAYTDNTPVMAQDESPTQRLSEKLRAMVKRWESKLNEGADDLARLFADKNCRHADVVLRRALSDAGFSVKFSVTKRLLDVQQAVIGENVGLIRSIGQQYFSEVETMVMRSAQNGRNLHQLTQELANNYRITKKRAIFIARDQNNKATAVFNRARQLDLGIKQARWMHSSAGKVPRQSHINAHDIIYDIAEGCWIDDAYIQPGELINCRCVSIPIIPSLAGDDLTS